LFWAPAAAHAFMSDSAFELEAGPFGGIFPPYHERHDWFGSVSAEPVPEM
jgi:hypothetical protein